MIVDQDLHEAIRKRPSDHVDQLLEVARIELNKAVVGQDAALEALLTAILARGHVLLEGPPGTAKTALARAMARMVGGRFQRVQFNRETHSVEILGQMVKRAGLDEFEKGPIFSNVLLVDEINRAPADAQAALLEAMQERHVTMRGRTYWIDAPFLVVATQNPHEHEGVFPLAESQLDRFLAKVVVSYASLEADLAMLRLPHRGVVTDVIGDIFPLLADGRLLRVQDVVDETAVSDEAARRIAAIVRATRRAEGVELGASPRSAIHLLAAAKARAALRGRRSVELVDIEDAAMLTLPHRILAKNPVAAVREAIEFPDH